MHRCFFLRNVKINETNTDTNTHGTGLHIPSPPCSVCTFFGSFIFVLLKRVTLQRGQLGINSVRARTIWALFSFSRIQIFSRPVTPFYIRSTVPHKTVTLRTKLARVELWLDKARECEKTKVTSEGGRNEDRELEIHQAWLCRTTPCCRAS